MTKLLKLNDNKLSLQLPAFKLAQMVLLGGQVSERLQNKV